MPEVTEGNEKGKESKEGTPSEKEVKQVAPEPTGKFGKELGHGSPSLRPFADKVTQEIAFLACARLAGQLNERHDRANRKR